MHLNFPWMKSLLISHPTLVDQVLVKQAANFEKDVFLKDVWPTNAEVSEAIRTAVKREHFIERVGQRDDVLSALRKRQRSPKLMSWIAGQRDADLFLCVITIAEIEPDKPATKVAEREEKPKTSAAAQQMGLSVTDLTDAQKKELKLKGGVVVAAATDAAARAGLREGDIILSVANTEVSGVKEFESVLSKADKSKPINVLYRRGEWAQLGLVGGTAGPSGRL